MQFGLDFFPAVSPEEQSGVQYFEQALNLTEYGEQLGFDFVKIVEHYFIPYGGYSPSPIVFLAAASQRTRNMRLITGCDLPIFNNPLKLASELAMLDAMSNGRLEIGLARAFIPQEFRKFGVNLDESRTRFDEGYEALLRLLTEERVTFKGPFHHFEEVTILPRPVQSPPPVWIAAVSTPKSFENAGKLGSNLMVVPYLADFHELARLLDLYRQAYKAAGHPASGGRIMMVFHLAMAEDGDQARAEAKPHMERYIKTFLEGVRDWRQINSPAYQGYQQMVDLLEDLTYEKVINEHRALIGSPEEIVEGFQYIQDIFGPTDPTLQVDFAGMSEENARRTMRLFAEHVMPRFRNLPTGVFSRPD